MGDRVLLARSMDENDLFNIMNLITEKYNNYRELNYRL